MWNCFIIFRRSNWFSHLFSFLIFVLWNHNSFGDFSTKKIIYTTFNFSNFTIISLTIHLSRWFFLPFYFLWLGILLHGLLHDGVQLWRIRHEFDSFATLDGTNFPHTLCALDLHRFWLLHICVRHLSISHLQNNFGYLHLLNYLISLLLKLDEQFATLVGFYFDDRVVDNIHKITTYLHANSNQIVPAHQELGLLR